MSALARRGFLRALLGAAATAGESLRAVSPAERRYRADARIVLLGIPLYTRTGVGGAYVAVRESPAQVVRRITIQFAAGSYPQRAAGLNRFGFIEEIVDEHGLSAEHAEYLGLMTASPEESLDQAKRSLKSPAKTAQFSAIRGTAGGGRFRNWLLRTTFPSSLRWSDGPVLAREIRSLFADSGLPGAVVREGPAEDARTFLYAVRQAMLAPSVDSRIPFLYNGTRFTLQTEKRPDSRMGRRFFERKLVAEPASVQQMNGVLTNHERRSKTDFRLWHESGAGPALPVRFEYRARSFLYLAFEYDPQLTEPNLLTVGFRAGHRTEPRA